MAARSILCLKYCRACTDKYSIQKICNEVAKVSKYLVQASVSCSETFSWSYRKYKIIIKSKSLLYADHIQLLWLLKTTTRVKCVSFNHKIWVKLYLLLLRISLAKENRLSMYPITKLNIPIIWYLLTIYENISTIYNALSHL